MGRPKKLEDWNRKRARGISLTDRQHTKLVKIVQEKGYDNIGEMLVGEYGLNEENAETKTQNYAADTASID